MLFRHVIEVLNEILFVHYVTRILQIELLKDSYVEYLGSLSSEVVIASCSIFQEIIKKKPYVLSLVLQAGLINRQKITSWT